MNYDNFDKVSISKSYEIFLSGYVDIADRSISCLMIFRQLNYVCKKDDISTIHIVVVHHILNIDFFSISCDAQGPLTVKS